MNRIELRGTIVSSIWDDGWDEVFIARGVIIPESRFRQHLAEAKTDEPLEIYVNSPGGSVFPAYEMVNAVNEWKKTSGQKVNVIVGAMAASAASSFAIMAGDTIKVHQNAKMMFHGAQVIAMGGKELLQDQADLLDKINGDVKKILTERYSMDAATVGEWFAEGREGWLTADEMKQSGIADEVLGDDAPPARIDAASIEAMSSKGLDIAAYLEIKQEDEAEAPEEPEEDPEGDEDSETLPERKCANCGNLTTNEPEEEDGDILCDECKKGEGDDDSGEADADSDKDSDDGDSEGGEDEGDADEVSEDEDPDAEPTDYKRGYEAGLKAGRAKVVSEYGERIATHTEKLTKAQDLVRSLQSEKDKAISDLKQFKNEANERTETLTEQLNEMSAKVDKFLNGSLLFSPQAPETWKEAMASCNGDYDEARKRFPDVHKALLAAANNKEK